MPSSNDNQLDQQVNTELMRVCKCVIPYLDRNVQKNVAIGVKFLELINTINTFSNDTSLSSLSLTRQGNWEEDLLDNVKANLSPEKAYLIDAVWKLKEFRSILQTKDPHEPDSPASFEPYPTTDPQDQASYFSDINDAPKTTRPPRMPNTSNTQRPPNSQRPSNTQGSSTTQNNMGSPTNILQMLSPLLDDNQKQLLNLLSAFLGPK